MVFIGRSRIICLICFLFLPSITLAQQVAGLTGTVTDISGASVPDVTVKLENTQTSATYNTRTNDLGVYIFSQLPPGDRYRLTFTKDNFRTLVLDNVSLGVGLTATHNVRLEIGSVTQVVEVTAPRGATLNTTDASVGNVLYPDRLHALPSLLRENPAAFLGLQPGVVANSGGGTNANGAVTGARTDQGNVTVDGIDSNDQAGDFAFTTVGNAPIESVLEFRTVSAGPDAAEGRSSGAQIELVTKSGTDEYHGSIYEYNRTSATAANDFFNNRIVPTPVPTPALTRNQFGASLGAPAIKHKLFYFFNYEGRRDARGSPTLRTVPLDHVRNGGVAYVHTGTDAIGRPCTATARLNDAVTSQCITILSPAQVAALDPKGIGADAALLTVTNGRYPHANDLTAGDGINTGGFRFNAPVSVSHNTYVSRVDFKINSKQTLFGRFNIVRENDTQTVQQFPGDPTPGLFADRSYSFVIGHTWDINANNVNKLTVGVNRQLNDFPVVFRPSFPNSITFGPFSGAFPGLSSQSRTVPAPTIRDDYSWIRAGHSFHFGVNIRPIIAKSQITNDFNFLTVGIGGLNPTLNASLRPNNIVSSAASQGEWDANFTYLLGRFASQGTNFNYTHDLAPLAPGTGKSRNFHYFEYEAYWEDGWHARNDLTITYGVRWSYYSVPFEANGFETTPNVGLSNLFLTRVQNGNAGIGGDSAAPLLVYDLAGKPNHAPGYYEPSLANFGPRLGIAWSPSYRDGFLGHFLGDRKTSVRLGGSIVYDREAGTLTFVADQVGYLFDDSPGVLFGAGNATTALMNDPRFTSITATPVVSVAPVHTRPVIPYLQNGVLVGEGQDQFNYAMDPNFRTPYSYVYSFGIQRELPANILLEVDYVGRLGRHLFTQADAAQIVNFRDPSSGQTLADAFNTISTALRAGIAPAGIPAQPFFENQGALALGASCASVVAPSCTRLIATNFSNTIRIGSLSNLTKSLAGLGLLRTNVGLAGQFSSTDYIASLGSSNYNGLLASVRKRLSRGLQMDVNYTYSHSIDNQSSVVNTVQGGTLCDLRNLHVCRGNSDFDARHIVSSNWAYELPFGRRGYILKNAPGWADRIVGGWEVSGIWTWRTGLALSPTAGDTPVNRSVTGHAVLTGSMSALTSNIQTTGTGAGTINFFSDAAAAQNAFAYPLGGQEGNRNIIPGPHFWNVDLAVIKDIRMPWRGDSPHKLQFRAEAFNAFNHENFGNPNLNINGTTFGQITGTTLANGTGPRQMQFALRYEF